MLGELLIEDGLVSKAQLQECLEYQKIQGGYIGQILINHSHITEEDLIRSLAIQSQYPHKKTVIIILSFVTILIAGIWLWRQSRMPFYTVEKKPISAIVKTNGTIKSKTTVHLSSSVVGRVKQITIAPGDTVKAGQIIVVLESQELAAEMKQAVARADAARIQLEKLKKGARPREIKKARAQSDGAKAHLDEASANLERAEKLYQSEVISANELEATRTKYKVAREKHTASRHHLELLKKGARQEDIDAARANLNEAQAYVEFLEAKAKEFTITAPMAGKAVQVDVNESEVVVPGNTLCRLINPEALMAEIKLEEVYIQSVSLGQPVALFVDAFPGTPFSGELIEIGGATVESLNRNLLKQEEDTKRFPIKISFLDPAAGLKTGMSVWAHIPCQRTTLVIPKKAIIQKAGQKMVWKRSNGDVKLTAVSTGLSNETEVEIIDGLRVGDKIQQTP